ncbi:hypothetical protein [Mesoplasma chauliocola]|uniref:hypothetical protein n=1 Tax=Mesoplasma chauliocola TaxID=216427 RepID=UPI000485B245|nr:hypothetical protein [Mesoplasma chauliocola]
MTEKQFKTYSALVKFFKKEYKYKNVDKKVKESRVLFINNNNEYALVQLEIEGTNETWSNIEVMAQKNFFDQKIKKLKIIISETTSQLTEKDDEIVLITTPENLKKDLLKFFPLISTLQETYLKAIKQKSTVNEIPEELNDEIKINNFKQALNKIKNNNVSFSWVILFFFIIMPVSFTIIGLFMNMYVGNGITDEGTSWLITAYQAPMLIFGGTNQTLTFAGGQYWRILTYGFSAMDAGSGILLSAFMIFFLTTALFSLTKLTEIVIGNVWKFSLSFLLAYLTLGFVVSATLPYTVTSGTLPIIGIMVGILVMNISGDTSPIAKFGKAKVAWPIVLIILSIFTSQDRLSSFSVLMSGIIFGSIFAALTKKSVKEWTWRENIMILFLVIFIVVGIVFVTTMKKIPAYNYNVIVALQFYGKNKIGGDLNHYNGIIEKIGWLGRFDVNTGNWNNKIITPLSSTYSLTTSNVLPSLDLINTFRLGM